jgi:hypothetical protein
VRTRKKGEQRTGTHSLEGPDDGQVRMQNTRERVMGTHGLENAERRTSEDTEGNFAKVTPTCWRAQSNGEVRTMKGGEHARATHSLKNPK